MKSCLNVALRALILFVVSASWSPESRADLPIQMGGVVDVTNDFGIENPTADAGRLKVRTFEVSAFGNVDETFDAVINIAGHDEAGTTQVELQEGFVRTSKLLPNTVLKAGRFYLGVGYLNQRHSYTWSFISPPKFQTAFFSKEPASDSGFEVRHKFDTANPVEVTVGATNGWNYGHTQTPGRRPLVATHYLRPSMNFDLGEGRKLAAGVSYLGRTDADSIQMRITGFDLSYVRSEGERALNLMQFELYHRLQSSSQLPLAEDLGGYFYSEWAVAEKWSAGLRLDAFTNLSLTTASGERRTNLEAALVPVLSFRASSSSVVRGTYTVARETRQGDAARVEQKIEIQVVTTFGMQPDFYGK